MVATEALGLGDKAEQSLRIATGERRHDSKDTTIFVWTPVSGRATLSTQRKE
jgi:hypothetical protein